jgi:hypothetical protein
MMRPRPNRSSPVRGVMHLMSLAAAALFLALEAASAQVQEGNQYLAFEDRFSADFPNAPTVRESSYTTELGIILPTRVHMSEDDFGKYSVTVVDWRNSEELYETFLAGCQDCDGAMPNDIRGAALHAAFGFVSRGGEVTYLGQMDTEEVQGVRIHLLNEDGSRTYGTTHWHEYRLYIIEATAPPTAPPPHFFPVSIGFIDEEGRRVRYVERYSPLFPTPARVR